MFSGDILSIEEKDYLQQKMKNEKRIDEEIVSYLQEINSFDFIQTTYSCYGHNGNTYLLLSLGQHYQ